MIIYMDLADFYNTSKVKKSKNKPNTESNLILELTKTPCKDKGADIPHVSNNILKPNVLQQADILYLPTDAFGYKYCLVVVDVFSKLCDAVALKERDSGAIVKGFEKIYSHDILKVPDIISCDSGSEFKGLTEDYFDKENTRIKYSLPNRHRQAGMVEARNKIIGSTIMKFQNGEELKKGKVSKAWVKYLPALIEAINKSLLNKKYKPMTDEVLRTKYSDDLIPLHTHVRAVLDHPINTATNKRLGSVFRSGDIRWNKTDRTVEKIILNPNLPPMYMLNGSKKGLDNKVAYTKSQLQIVKKD